MSGPRIWMPALEVGDWNVLARFCKRIVRDDLFGCWNWQDNRETYGMFAIKLGMEVWAQTTAHSAAYVLFVGLIPEGFVVDHQCENKKCVNPDHLQPMPHRDNSVKGVGPEVVQNRHRARTHCSKGHEYPPRKPGAKRRQCDTCKRVAERLRRQSA